MRQVFLALLIVGCGASASVRAVRIYSKPEQVSQCIALGPVSAWAAGYNANAEDGLREQALKLGGDAVLLADQNNELVVLHTMKADAYRCAKGGKRPAFMRANAVILHKPARVLVVDFRMLQGDPNLGVIFTNLIAAELQKVQNLTVIDRADLEAVLDVERKKDLLACDSTTCLTELGGALNTNLIIYGTIGTAGVQYIVTASLFDTRAAKARARFTRAVDRKDENLIGVVAELSQAMAGGLVDK